MIYSGDPTHGFICCAPARTVSRVVSGRFGIWRRHLSCRSSTFGKKFRHPPQVDRCHGQSEYQFGAFEATQLQLSKGAVLFAVAEDGFDQFASDLTYRVARMASGALIDRTGAVFSVLGDVRSDPDGAAISDEVSGVITFVSTYGLGDTRLRRQHLEGGL